MLVSRLSSRYGTPTFKGRSGFSILEVVATIALIMLLSSLIIGGLSKIDSFTNGDKTTERALFSAVKSASNIAQSKLKYIELTYDKRGFFELADIETAEVLKRIFLKSATQKAFDEVKKQNKEYIAENVNDADDVVFVLEKPIIYGKERTQFPMQDRQSVIFAPDGSSCQFSVTIKSKVFDSPIVLQFDNFSATVYDKK